MKLKKILAAVAAAAVAVSTMAVNAFAAEVWSGSKDVGTSWSEYVTVEGLSPAEGQVMTVNFTVNDGTSGQVIAKCTTDGWPALECQKNTTHPGYNGDVTVVEGSETSVTYTLTAKDCEDIKSTSLLVAGSGITITSIDISDGVAPAESADDTAAEPAAQSFDIDAAIYFADTSWGVQDNASSVKVTDNGQFVIESTAVAGAPDLGVFVIDIKDMHKNYPAATAVLDKVEIDGAEVAFDASKIVYGDIEDNGNYRIEIYNQYGDTKDNAPIDPATKIDSSLKLTFTVSGLEAAAAPVEETATAVADEQDEDEDVDVDVEEEEPEEVEEPEEPAAAPAAEETPAPAAETATAAPATGNTAVASIVAVMAVAGAAALVSKKRK